MCKKLTAILITALVVILGVLTAVVIIANQPAAVLERTVENTLDDLTEREELDLLFDVLEKGSVEISVPESNRVMGTAVDAKIYFDGFLSSKAPEVYAENLTVQKDKVSFSGDLYFSKDYAYFRDSDKDAYGIVPGEMKDTFLASPLAAESNSPWSLTADVSEDVAVLMEIFDDQVLEDLARDADKTLKKYEKKLKKLMLECLEIYVENQEVTVDGDNFHGRVVTVSMDEESAAEILMGLYDLLAEDENLRKKVLSYGAYFCEKLDLDFDVTKWYDEDFMTQKTWKAMADSVEATNFKYTVKIVTPKMRDTACLLTVELFMDGETTELFSVDFGSSGIASTEKITVRSLGDTHILKVEENNKDTYRLAVYQKLQKVETEVESLTIDRKGDTYAFERGIYTYSGRFAEEKGRVEITLDECRSQFGPVRSYGIRMVLDGSDRMPTPVRKGNVKPLFDLTEDKLKKIKDVIGGGLQGSYTGKIGSFNATLIFNGAGQVTLATTYGKAQGYYYVWDDTIHLTFTELESQGDLLTKAVYTLEGSSNLIVKEKHIRIGKIQFNKS